MSNKTNVDNTITVLVVEDSTSINRLITNTLKELNYNVKSVMTGKEAIDYIKTNQNVLILLDYILPDMNGLDVIKELHKMKYYVPFMVMTGQGNEKIAVEMMKLGAADYLVKDDIFIALIPSAVEKVLRNITIEKEKKEADEKIKSLLAEKELLLRETHHRIKNNMNVIRSILGIEAAQQDNEVCKKILNDASNRVLSMITLYDYLYKQEITREINIKYFLNQLIKNLLEVHKNILKVKTIINIDDIVLEPKQASSVGLIINEMFTNSIKYAFNEQTNGIINISMKKKDNSIVLVFSDNGVGLPETITFDNCDSFGLKLISMLVKNINGTIKIDRQQGTKFTVKIS